VRLTVRSARSWHRDRRHHQYPDRRQHDITRAAIKTTPTVVSNDTPMVVIDNMPTAASSTTRPSPSQ
jgi:hypothetical protein